MFMQINLKSKLIAICLVLVWVSYTYAQIGGSPNFWRLSGNINGTGIAEVNASTNNNFLGSTATGNLPPQPVRMGTNGISRIFMSTSNPIVGGGFIGIGNDFLQPQNRLHQHDNDVNLHQFTNNK